jgi:BirA family biotin operon repressor/biotin-[acetyl-CoA-carboxylase] ligase
LPVTYEDIAIPGSIRLEEGQQRLLRLLSETAEYLSGEDLGERLGLSRTAIWKRIERLRDLGYQVEGSPRRGYRLAAGQDLLWLPDLLVDLPLQRLRGPVHHFVSLPSTNDAAKELARRGAPEGTVCLAETQTAGRGRLGRQWESPLNTGIYLSLILRPPLPPLELPKLTLIAAVAVVEAIHQACGVATGIKWPNDIIFAGKKLGGILTEMETESDAMSHVVLGVGLNVNTAAFPEPLQEIAISLASAGQTYSRTAIVRAFLMALDRLYGRFLRQEFPAILEQWRQHAVMLGKMVTIRQGPATITGVATDVALDGALLLVRPDGSTVRVLSGEIQKASCT